MKALAIGVPSAARMVLTWSITLPYWSVCPTGPIVPETIRGPAAMWATPRAMFSRPWLSRPAAKARPPLNVTLLPHAA